MDETRQFDSYQHQVTIINREQMAVKGVTHVESFDDQEVVLETDVGLLAIRGEDIHIKQINLDEGQLMMEGLFSEVQYVSGPRARGGRAKGRGLIERLFR